MPSKIRTHTHKYQRIKWGRRETIVLRCMLPDCHHYVHPEMAIGRKSICHKCGKEFILNKDSVNKLKPKCEDCSLGADPVLLRLDGLLEGLGDDE